MKKEKILLVISILGICIFTFLGCSKNQEKVPINNSTLPKMPIDSSSIELHNTTFATNLMKTLLKNNKNNNIFISPLSIFSILSETENGSVGAAKNELNSVLSYDTTDPNIQMKNLANYYNGLQSTSIKLANSMWIKNNSSVNKDFISSAKEYYNSDVKNIDFQDSASSHIINQWISDKTNKKITNLNFTFDKSTNLLLVNSIYFKAQWLHQFNKNATTKGDFNTADGKKVTVDMMKQKGSFSYFENKDFQVIDLPYRDNFSMYIFLPKQGKNIENYVNEIDPQKIENYIKILKEESINITMPKLNFQYETDLASSLKLMGINKVFSPENNWLIGISKNLYLNNIIHKSYLSIDENGTEAAAVTTEILSGTAMPQSPEKDFIVTRPFLMSIRDDKTGLILFTGLIKKPN